MATLLNSAKISGYEYTTPASYVKVSFGEDLSFASKLATQQIEIDASDSSQLKKLKIPRGSGYVLFPQIHKDNSDVSSPDIGFLHNPRFKYYDSSNNTGNHQSAGQQSSNPTLIQHKDHKTDRNSNAYNKDYVLPKHLISGKQYGNVVYPKLYDASNNFRKESSNKRNEHRSYNSNLPSIVFEVEEEYQRRVKDRYSTATPLYRKENVRLNRMIRWPD